MEHVSEIRKVEALQKAVSEMSAKVSGVEELKGLMQTISDEMTEHCARMDKIEKANLDNANAIKTIFAKINAATDAPAREVSC
jgi:hypothetical protein